ncbi:PREDICTED: protein FAM117B-like, partial [Rhinopithecus bieti]|uniref:protein FAM117B-like n=1 Tax=Rhinopithecus bieti TaxID=61621 RepID=UPI00083C6FED
MSGGGGGGGCTTSLLPVPARSPPAPRSPASSSRAGACPPASRILPLQPNNNKTPPSRPVTGEGGTMSQRVRRNGSPTPAGSLGGGAVATAGGPGSRLQPMRATVPFQLKQQQQHGSPTRSGGGGNNNGGCCGGASGPAGGGGGGPRTASRSTSPT